LSSVIDLKLYLHCCRTSTSVPSEWSCSGV